MPGKYIEKVEHPKQKKEKRKDRTQDSSGPTTDPKIIPHAQGLLILIEY